MRFSEVLREGERNIRVSLEKETLRQVVLASLRCRIARCLLPIAIFSVICLALAFPVRARAHGIYRGRRGLDLPWPGTGTGSLRYLFARENCAGTGAISATRHVVGSHCISRRNENDR